VRTNNKTGATQFGPNGLANHLLGTYRMDVYNQQGFPIKYYEIRVVNRSAAT
jgi:hypothetical protein